MLGFAERIFFEKTGRHFGKEKGPFWPFLSRMVEQGFLSYVDVAIAKTVLRLYPEAPESAAAFIAYLSAIAQAGHMCAYLNSDNHFHPDPLILMQTECIIHQPQTFEIDLEEFRNILREGVNKVPKSLIADEESESFPSRPICRWNQVFYLQKNWVDETFCLNAFRKLLSFKPSISFKESDIVEYLLSKQTGLLPEQLHAIKTFLYQSFSILSGGPGTGKTYTASLFIQIFLELLSEKQRTSCKIALAAPTGKAAANLQKGISHHFTAKTLHQLLHLSLSGKKAYQDVQKVPYDLIIIDEGSMVDMKMMAYLLMSVKEGARIVLLGDPKQLSPVGVGSPFLQLIHCCNQIHHPVGVLTRCQRSELSSIVNFASSVDRGDVDGVLNSVHRKTMASGGANRQLQHLLNETMNHFLNQTSQGEFCLLSPLREGIFGVNSLNQLFFCELILRSKHLTQIVIPVIIVKNDFQRGLMNGDVGLLFCQKSSVKEQKLRLQFDDYAIQ